MVDAEGQRSFFRALSAEEHISEVGLRRGHVSLDLIDPSCAELQDGDVYPLAFCFVGFDAVSVEDVQHRVNVTRREVTRHELPDERSSESESFGAHAVTVSDPASARSGRKYLNSALTPLVFLILPVTVAFAVLPGILVLQLGF